MDDFYERMGKRVAQRRQARRMTQEQLAEASGIVTSYVARIEAGTRKPTLDVLRRIADVVNAELWEFVTDSRLTIDEKEWRARERKLAAEIQSVSVSDLEFVIALVRRLKR